MTSVLLIIVLTVAGAGALIYQSDLILPGVQIQNVPLGGRFSLDATEMLQGVAPDVTIELVGDNFVRPVPASSLGIRLDAEATVARAHSLSRSSNRLNDIVQGLFQIDVEPIWTVDSDSARQTLQSVADEYQIQPMEASLTLVEGQVWVTPATDGRLLDLASTLHELTSNPRKVIENAHLELLPLAVHPPNIDSSAAVDRARQFLSHSIMITAHDPVRDETYEWLIAPEQWNLWMKLDASNLEALRWEIDQGELLSHLLDLESSLSPECYFPLEEAVNNVNHTVMMETWEVRLRIYHHSIQYEVQAGDTLASIGREHGIPYPWIQTANPTVEDTLRPGQVINIPSVDEMIPLPIVEDKRIIVSISQQKMWVFEEHAIKWEWRISTGIDSSPTSPGVFQIQSHEIEAYAENWDLWMPYFMGIYRPIPTSDFMNGFHGFPTRGGSQLLWTANLGQPVTYGCILLEQENAAALFEWANEGTLVEIQP